MIDWNKIQTPLELARQLWSTLDFKEVVRLSPERFQSLFDRVYLSTDSLEALWQLGGATNDYLRANPEVISVPLDLPRRLLASDHMDARIVGLKLLNRCGVHDEEIVQAMVRAMHRRDEHESCGGIHELHIFLDSRHQCGAGLDKALVAELTSALHPLVDDGVEVHSGATHAMARLREFP